MILEIVHLNDSRTQVKSRHRQNTTKCRCSSVFCVLINSTTSISSIKLPGISPQYIAIQMCFSRSFSSRHLVLSAIIILFIFLLHSCHSSFVFFSEPSSPGNLYYLSCIVWPVSSSLCLPYLLVEELPKKLPEKGFMQVKQVT